MQTNLLSPTDCINHFVALSKCLPGLNGAIPDDASGEEHSGIEALRKRIVASMNHYLDALKLPGKTPNDENDVRPTVKFIGTVIDVCETEMRKLRDGLCTSFPSAGHASIINAAVGATVQQIARELHKELVDATAQNK